MSSANLLANRGHFYCPHVKPVLIDCNFVVDSTNGNGLGIRSLKGQGVNNVFMHTAETPGPGPNGLVNPNPASGYIMVQLGDNYNFYYGGFSGFVPPLSGSNVNVDASDAALSVGQIYVIVSLGTSTAADWLALGVPPGITPAVGVPFCALVTGAGTGTGKVQTIAATGSGVDHIEVVGNSNLTTWPIPVGGSPNVGAWLILACFGKAFNYNSGTPANSTVTDAIVAPANGTVIGLSFYLSQSSVTVAGE